MIANRETERRTADANPAARALLAYWEAVDRGADNAEAWELASLAAAALAGRAEVLA